MLNADLAELQNQLSVDNFMDIDNFSEIIDVGNLRGGRIEQMSGWKSGKIVVLYVQINDITAGGGDIAIFVFKDAYKKYAPIGYAVHNAYIDKTDNFAYIGQFSDGHFSMAIMGTGTISSASKAMVLDTITYMTRD